MVSIASRKGFEKFIINQMKLYALMIEDTYGLPPADKPAERYYVVPQFKSNSDGGIEKLIFEREHCGLGGEIVPMWILKEGGP